MKGPGALSLAVNAGLVALLVWLYGGDLAGGVRALGAEVVADELPYHAGVAAGALGLAAIAVGAYVYGLVRGYGPAFKGYRLLAIVTALGVFAELFTLTREEVSLSASARLAVALERLAGQANGVAASTGKPPAAEVLRPYLAELGDPPYRVRGEPARGYALQVREGCNGPVAEAPGARVGTFLYCFSGDGKTAWLTVVGLPVEVRSGAPAVLGRDGQPLAAQIAAPAPGNTPDGPAPP